MIGTEEQRIAEHFKVSQTPGDELGERMGPSRIDTLKLCPKKYYWHYEKRIQPKGHMATAANFGSAIHAAIATFYEGRAFDAATCPCEAGCKYCESSHKQWSEDYQGMGKPIPNAYAQFLLNYPTNPQNEKDNRTQDFGLELIYEYIKRYGRETGVEILLVEETFIVPYPEFTLVGRLDLVLKSPLHIFARDLKTSSRVDLLFLTASLSMQAGLYLLGLSKIFGEHISTMEIDAASTGKYASERFKRLTLNFTPDDLALVEQEMFYYWDQIKRHRASGLWPRSAPFACTAYNQTCEYYPICYSKENPETIENSYERIERITV